MKQPTFSVALVAPFHIPPTESWLRAVSAILQRRPDTALFIVDDSKNQNLREHFPAYFQVYTREDQKDTMGEELYNIFTIFHRSSACKNFGHYVAWKNKFDIIIGLDSDCEPELDFIGKHLEALMRTATGWTNPIKKTGLFPRGFPYQERMRRTIGNLGLWSGLLDIGGKDRTANEPKDPQITEPHAVSDGFIPFSGMNWALWADAIPGFLFLPNFNYNHKGKEYQFRRHDDIWGGYIFQKFMEKRNERLMYGEPIVFHNSGVDAKKDADEEEGMVIFENDFYNSVDQVMLKVSPGEYEDMFREFAVLVATDWKETEWAPLIAPIKMWADLFT